MPPRQLPSGKLCPRKIAPRKIVPLGPLRPLGQVVANGETVRAARSVLLKKEKKILAES